VTNGGGCRNNVDATVRSAMIAVVTARGRLSMPLLLAIATVFGVSSSIQAYFLQLATGEKSPALFSHVMVLNMVYWYVPALVAPVIMWLA